MTYISTRNLRALAVSSLALVVLLVVACGTAGQPAQPVQQAEPQVIEREVVKETAQLFDFRATAGTHSPETIADRMHFAAELCGREEG